MRYALHLSHILHMSFICSSLRSPFLPSLVTIAVVSAAPTTGASRQHAWKVAFQPPHIHGPRRRHTGSVINKPMRVLVHRQHEGRRRDRLSATSQNTRMPFHRHMTSTSEIGDPSKDDVISEHTKATESPTTTAASSQQTLQMHRPQLLRQALHVLGIAGDDVHRAAIASIEDPTGGYDPAFGRSAIRTYRAFIYPKQETYDDSVRLKAAADRCARQIEFLIKRNESHQTAWVRHHDQDGAVVIAQSSTDADNDDDATAARQSFPIILILDNLRSAFNVGSIFRTADACGCQLIITTGITPHPTGSGSDKVAKSALGADRVVPNLHFATTREAVEFVRKEYAQFGVYALETTDKSQSYTQWQYPDSVALILGNEVTGVDTKLMADMDAILELPTFGVKNSLNVAACAPVVLYEILRQWGK